MKAYYHRPKKSSFSSGGEIVVECSWCERQIFRTARMHTSKKQLAFCGEACKNARGAAIKRLRVRESKLGRCCEVCGSDISDRRANVKWCSASCATKAQRIRQPTLRWRSNLKQYGLTIAEYDVMLESQQGRCAICGGDRPKGRGNRMAVDHCHTTGLVRGLLCGNCNLALGLLAHDPSVLESAVAYLGR